MKDGQPNPPADFDSRGMYMAVVVSRFHEPITSRLREAAVATLLSGGATSGQVVTVEVPGAFELPLAAKALAETGRYDAVICLGCVIRGDTPHFDFVCQEAAAGIMRAGLDTGVPVIFGVLTCVTEQQAWDRAGGSVGNKGVEAAYAAVEMAQLLRKHR